MTKPLMVSFVFLIAVTGTVLGIPTGGNIRLGWNYPLSNTKFILVEFMVDWMLKKESFLTLSLSEGLPMHSNTCVLVSSLLQSGSLPLLSVSLKLEHIQ